MIITKTPFRMSFFGGGTDMESFFREYGGAVLSTTFDKYCYVNVRHLPRFFEWKNELSYSRTERVVNVEDIEHPAIRNAMQMLDMHEIRLMYEADLPARSGLGTSSSFAVGMLNAFHCLKGKYADKKKLADEAIYLERELCQEAGGWQDQIAASYGGMNRIEFNKDGTYDVKPIIIHPDIITNIYGVGEKSARLIYTSIVKLIKGERCSFTEGCQTYDFIYISDAINSMVEVSEKGKAFTRYYIGSGNPKPLREYLLQMRDIVAPGVELGLGDIPFNGINIDYNQFEMRLVEKDTGYKNMVSFDEGIKMTAEYIRKEQGL